jgi:hypothetical protein
MATIQSNNHPGSRIDVGDLVLERAKARDTKSVKARLAAFAAAHAAYAKAEREVRAAEESQLAQEGKAAEADVVQDAAVDALATAMAGDGAPRTAPFRPIGFGAPSDVKAMAYAKEAKECKRIAKAALAWKPGTAKTKSAAKKLAAAAAVVEKALSSAPAMRKKTSGALARRDALGQAWRTAFEKLKNAARTAEDDGAQGLFDALFHDDARAAPKAKKAATAPIVATNGGPAPAP